MLKRNEIRLNGKAIPSRASKRTDTAAVNAPKVAGVLDAVEDQYGGHWIRYGTPDRACWFSVPELLERETDVFKRLATVGYIFVTTSSKSKFKRLVEAHQGYRSARIAARPGWLGGHYVFGDGTIIAPPGNTHEIIIAFDKDPKFTPRGTTKGWQQAVGPVIAHQSLPLFITAYSFIGAVVKFAPSDFLNPQAELVGDPGTGKSTLAIFSASAWAGDRTSDVGGAESWNVTNGYIDPLKVAHADNNLVLEEANLAGLTQSDQRDMIQRTIFQVAAKGGRKRLTDKAAVPNVNVGLLSTSNKPLREIIGGSGAVSDALQSRMITIQIAKGSPLGVLSSLPKGFPSSRKAMEHLRQVIDEQYGCAGRAFIQRLVIAIAEDEAELRRRVRRLIDRFLAELDESAIQGAAARVAKTFALTYAAGMLARKWGILPKEWGPLLPAILQVYRSVTDSRAAIPTPVLAIDAVRAYVKQHKGKIVRERDVQQPLDLREFQRAAGFLRKKDGREEILIPTRQFRREFKNQGQLMKNLRDTGLARTEQGEQAKLSIKTPKHICDRGRVYCIRLSD